MKSLSDMTLGMHSLYLLGHKQFMQFLILKLEFAIFLYKLHEAIMREDSTEFEEGVIIDEFRKGFKLGDRLLRPSMVKVSAGPGPAKPDQQVPPSEEQDASETTKEGSTETESA